MNYAQALQVLLSRPENDLVQVLYLKLESGKVLVFLGAPVTEEDALQIKDIVFGEQIPPSLVGLSAMMGNNVMSQ